VKSLNLTATVFLMALTLQGCAVHRYVGCGKTPNLELVSLAIYRDPLPEARKIDQWRAIIRSDSSDICQTTVSIVEAESKQLITHETLTDLSQGANQILLYSLDDYRLSGKELCFEVHVFIDGKKVFIDGKKIPLDAPRRFCARTIDRGWWSMR
jgi:hypothetical protein